MGTFPAFRIFSTDGKIHGSIVDATLEELSAGEVIIKAAYSSVNYKDALAATGSGKIFRRFPLIGGIDVSGTVFQALTRASNKAMKCLSPATRWQ